MWVSYPWERVNSSRRLLLSSLCWEGLVSGESVETIDMIIGSMIG